MAAVSRDLYGERSGRNRGAPGRIREWSTTYRWCERAEAWDAHLDEEARRAAVEARRAMQERHERTMSAVNARLMTVFEKADDGIPVDRAARAIRESIAAEREIAMKPIAPAPFGPAPGTAAVSVEHSVTIEDVRRFEASPEVYASVAAILAQYETKMYPPDPAPDADDEADAPADPEPSSPAAAY